MILNSIEDTSKLAIEIASKLKGTELIFLNGELGAGKTTFTKSLFKALQVNELVNSPTFAILKQYQSKYGKITHIDAYRIESVEDIYDEFYTNNIRVVEWSNNLKDIDIKPNLIIDIKVIDETKREVTITWT